MSTYDSYEEVPRRHKSHRSRRDRDDREPRYVETREETYVRGPAIVDPYAPHRGDLTLRHQDSDMSVEEVHRDFPPPVGVDSRRMVIRDERYGPPVRSRSYERDRRRYEDDYYGDPRRSENTLQVDKKVERRRSLSRNEKIASGIAGAAIAVAAKEFYDYRQGKEHPNQKQERDLKANVAIAAMGAAAGYGGAEVYTKVKERKGEKKHTKEVVYDRDGRVVEYYEEEKNPEKKSRRKSIIEGALGLAGFGAGAKAIGDRDRGDDDRSRRRRGSDASDRSRRSRMPSPDKMAKIQQAAKAALMAGAAEAFRVSKAPGGWDGAKGKRVLTAALAGGGIGAAASKGEDDHKSKRHLLEAVVGGLAGSRMAHGSRKELDVDDDGKSIRGGRSRSRSRAPSRSGSGLPLKALAGAAIAGLAAKKAHSRSRSRDRSRRRDSSEDSYRSRGNGRRRSRSVTDMARRGMAALGIREASRDDREVVEETRIKKTRRRRDSRDDRDRGYESSDDEYDRRDRSRRSSRHADGGRETRNRRVAEGKQNLSDSDSLGSSTDDEKRIKKMKGKQVITASLATVASIHAAHGVYQSWEKRKARHKAVEAGDMTPEQARKQRAKARLQDAASVGIAVLGVKGAISGKFPSPSPDLTT